MSAAYLVNEVSGLVSISNLQWQVMLEQKLRTEFTEQLYHYHEVAYLISYLKSQEIT